MDSVKQKLFFKVRFLIPFVAALATLAACNETGDLGMDLLPSSDLIDVKSLVEKENISAYTYTDGPIRTDEPTRSLLGSLNDPHFGTTNVNFATQFRLLNKPELGVNPVADSVKLYLYYRLIYGDTVTPQTFRVYELETPLVRDESYNQDIDLKSFSSDYLLGEIAHIPAVRQDSATRDTFYQSLVITLDNTIGNKLLNAPESTIENNDAFLEYFKGLLIESVPQTNVGGTVMTLEAAYSDIWQGSAMLVYYKNDEYRFRDTSLTIP